MPNQTSMVGSLRSIPQKWATWCSASEQSPNIEFPAFLKFSNNPAAVCFGYCI
jgi:hypothetical protein